MGTTGLDFNDIYDEYHEKLLHYLQRMIGKGNAWIPAFAGMTNE